MTAKLSAMGGYVPDHAIGNDEIASWIGQTPDWIERRTGIRERRYAGPDVPTSELAQNAVLDMAERFPGALDDLDAIIVATSTPDRPQPPTAAFLQKRLGLSGVPAFDLNSVCAGFLFGLDAAALRAEHRGERVLLVAADEYSVIMDREDRKTVTLFGDGAGAAIVEPCPDPDAGLRSLVLTTHGDFAEYVTVPAGGTGLPHAATPKDHLFKMDGRAVKEYVLATIPLLLANACAQARIKPDEIGSFICHQANTRLLETLADILQVPHTMIPLTAPDYGNTGAASLPITLAAVERSGGLVPGVPVALIAVGGGMSAGAGIYIP